MVDMLNFAHRKRLTKFAKELLALPCMSGAAHEDVDAAEPAGAAAAPGRGPAGAGVMSAGKYPGIYPGKYLGIYPGIYLGKYLGIMTWKASMT